MDETEQALLICQKQKQAVLDGSNDIIILFNRDLHVVWANRRIERICSEPKGLSCRQLLCGENGECDNCVIAGCLNGCEPGQVGQKTIVVNSSKSEVILALSATSIVHTGGDVQSVMVFAQDISENMRLEKQLRHASKMEAIGTLAGGIAHDFNNILTPIMGYSEIMRLNIQQDSFGRHELVAHIDQILEASRRAQKLVKQILAFSRNSEEKDSAQAVQPIVKEGLKLIQATIPSNVRLVTHIDENCGSVRIDPVEIHQILINLCANAVDAMNGMNGILTVVLCQTEEAESQKKWLELRVSDNGCGVADDSLERIFDPYFTTKEKVQGTGMGLAVVHGIVARQSGKINVKSKVGLGTAVSICFPVVEEYSEYEKLTNITEMQGSNQRILLIDDEKQVVSVTAGVLRKIGYNVKEMTSAQKALLLFLEGSDEFDLVMTDLTMPFMNGIELCAKMKEIRPDLPVLLYSGALEEYSRSRAVQAGVNGFCLKPASMSEMAKTIHQLLV